MKVFKFGGASVKDAAGFENVCRIVASETDKLVVVVSAIGKTTNALEVVVNAVWEHREEDAQARWEEIQNNHQTVARALGVDSCIVRASFMHRSCKAGYDELYDDIVSNGELMSSRLLSAYLERRGIPNTLLLMPDLLVTDDTFREAKVDTAASAKRICEAVNNSAHRVCVVQGFIGGTPDGRRTTLGREGSDYTAAMVANFLDAQSVTIWKDVPGILNADPRLVSDTVLIPELSYSEAVELAYSGAQVIHPKSIRPVENKKIPLYVKPFGDPTAAGSVICQTDRKVDVPVYIWRKNQLLITMRAKDFSFILEESLSHIFDIIKRHRLKVSLIQSSAVTISVCVDNSRYVTDAINELHGAYAVTYNEGLSLLTIRGTTPEILHREAAGRQILLTQNTRRTARFVVKE